jgi:hypothetical protein
METSEYLTSNVEISARSRNENSYKGMAMDLNKIGYDVTISLESVGDESNFELIIRKQLTTSEL